jgi:hypothetical protein
MQLSQAQLTYQLCPIWLTGGIATNISGGMLPVLALTNPNAFTPDMQNGADDFAMDDAFAIFQPAVGGSLSQQTIAQYPFANLSVAANAIIREPIVVSMIMMTPMKSTQAWEMKLSIMTALKQTLDSHNNAGGTYTVVTPAYTYDNVLLNDLVDVSMAQSPLPQNAWRWDFTRPLVTQADAVAAMSNLMNQITSGTSSGNNLTNGGSSADESSSGTINPTSPNTISDPSTVLGQPPSLVNTGPGAGGTSSITSITSPWTSQTQFTTMPLGGTYGKGNFMPGGGATWPGSS